MHGLSALFSGDPCFFQTVTLSCMRNEFRTLFISGLSEKKENHVQVPDLSVIITSGSLHSDCEARLWHVLLQKLYLIAEHRKCTYLGGRGWDGARMKKFC